MQLWEYYFIVREPDKLIMNGNITPPVESWWNFDPNTAPFIVLANGLGKDGWEMVSFNFLDDTNYSMAFKRLKLV